MITVSNHKLIGFSIQKDNVTFFHEDGGIIFNKDTDWIFLDRDYDTNEFVLQLDRHDRFIAANLPRLSVTTTHNAFSSRNKVLGDNTLLPTTANVRRCTITATVEQKEHYEEIRVRWPKQLDQYMIRPVTNISTFMGSKFTFDKRGTYVVKVV